MCRGSPPATVYDAAQRGDPLAQEVVRDTAASSAPASRTCSISSIPTSSCSRAASRERAKRCSRRCAPRCGGGRFVPAVDACRIVPGALAGNRGRRRRRRDLQGPGAGADVRVGVIGTFVWDIIYGRDARVGPLEEWGGITYAMSAFDAALPDHVGDRPHREGRDGPRAIAHVPICGRSIGSHPTRRSLKYPTPTIASSCATQSEERRSEQLRGGVPGWSWIGLPAVARADSTPCT